MIFIVLMSFKLTFVSTSSRQPAKLELVLRFQSCIRCGKEVLVYPPHNGVRTETAEHVFMNDDGFLAVRARSDEFIPLGDAGGATMSSAGSFVTFPHRTVRNVAAQSTGVVIVNWQN